MNKWSWLRVATWNIGNGTIQDAVTLMVRVDVLLVQEASDQDKMLRHLEALGYAVIRPVRQPGQAAVAVVYDPSSLEYRKRIARSVARRQDVGPGTGPDVMKVKWLIGGYFIHRESGRRISLSSTHRVASNNKGIRERIAIRHAKRVVEIFKDYTGITIVGMDANSVATDNTLSPMRRAGFKCNQLIQKIVTKGKGWAPDGIWWLDRRLFRKRITFGHHFTVPTKSDHDALVVSFNIRNKRKRRK